MAGRGHHPRVIGDQLVEKVVAHRAEEPPGEVVGALVVAADDEGDLAPLPVAQSQVGRRHGAVGAVGEEDEAVLIQLAVGLEPLEFLAPGGGHALGGRQCLPPPPELPDAAPVVVAGDHQGTLGVRDRLRLVPLRERAQEGRELRPAAGDQQGDAAGGALVEPYLDRLRPFELQPRRLRDVRDRDAAPGGRPIGLGLADPLADGKSELGEVLAQHGEGAARAGLSLQLFPERHECLVGEREAHLWGKRAEVERVLVVSQQLGDLRARGPEARERLGLQVRGHVGSVRELVP